MIFFKKNYFSNYNVSYRENDCLYVSKFQRIRLLVVYYMMSKENDIDRRTWPCDQRKLDTIYTRTALQNRTDVEIRTLIN